MKCPFCRHLGKTKTVDARPSPNGYRRRRACSECGKRFTTREHIAYPILIVVEICGSCDGRGLLETTIASDAKLHESEASR